MTKKNDLESDIDIGDDFEANDDDQNLDGDSINTPTELDGGANKDGDDENEDEDENDEDKIDDIDEEKESDETPENQEDTSDNESAESDDESDKEDDNEIYVDKEIDDEPDETTHKKSETKGTSEHKKKQTNCFYDAIDVKKKKVIALKKGTINPHQKSIRITDDKEKITKPILFKYERVRAIGIRTKQIANGAQPMIRNVSDMTSKEIAVEELRQKVMPLVIVRGLPSGEKEIYDINKLKVIN